MVWDYFYNYLERAREAGDLETGRQFFFCELTNVTEIEIVTIVKGAGRVGFEPTVHCCTEVFKTSAINLTRPSTHRDGWT